MVLSYTFVIPGGGVACTMQLTLEQLGEEFFIEITLIEHTLFLLL